MDAETGHQRQTRPPWKLQGLSSRKQRISVKRESQLIPDTSLAGTISLQQNNAHQGFIESLTTLFEDFR